MSELIHLRLKLEKDDPLDLEIFATSLTAFSASLKEFVAKETGTTDSALKIREVSKGSYIIDLVAIMGTFSLPFVDYITAINTYFDFLKNIGDISKRSVEDIRNDNHLSKSMIENLRGFISPAHKDGAEMFLMSGEGNTFNNNFFITPEGAVKIAMGLAIAEQTKGFAGQERVKAIFEKMAISFYQTTNTDKNVKFRAHCYELSPKAIPIILDDDRLKAEVLDNPYNYSFICDIEAYKDEKGEIRSYRAFNYLDKIEIVRNLHDR